MINFPENKKIIMFDGVCNLCNRSVQKIIRHDKKDIFRFVPLQSEIGRQIINERGIDTAQLDSILLIEPGIAYYHKSTAVLMIAGHLDKYSWLRHLKVLPEGFRDAIYSFVARNRYNWFGKKDRCMVPTPQSRDLFLK